MTNQDLFLIFGALILIYLIYEAIKITIKEHKQNKEENKKAHH